MKVVILFFSAALSAAFDAELRERSFTKQKKPRTEEKLDGKVGEPQENMWSLLQGSKRTNQSYVQFVEASLERMKARFSKGDKEGPSWSDLRQYLLAHGQKYKLVDRTEAEAE